MSTLSQDDHDDSDYLKEPYLLDRVEDMMQGHQFSGFDEVKKDLDQHLETYDRLQTIEEERSKYQHYINDPEPQFNNFLSTTYSKYGRDYPEKVNGAVQRAVLQNPINQVGFQRTNLKQELRDLKIFTIIDKLNGNTDEIERDIVSLHSEMPKYFSKPRLYGQVLPEVLKNKQNLITVLRGIKSRDEKQGRRRNESTDGILSKVKLQKQIDRVIATSPGFTRNMLKSALTSPNLAAQLVDPRKIEPPPEMYSRSFMYVKMHQPNMRLDISQPKSTFEVSPSQAQLLLSKQKMGNDLAAAQAAIPVITQDYIENQQNKNTAQEMDNTLTKNQITTSKKNIFARDIHTSSAAERPPKYYQPTKAKNEQFFTHQAQQLNRGQTPTPDAGSAEKLQQNLGNSSTSATNLNKQSLDNKSMGTLPNGLLAPNTAFNSFAPQVQTPSGHTQQSIAQQTLIYTNSPQFAPQSVALSPPPGHHYTYSKSGDSKLRSKSPNKTNQDQSSYYENKMLKPLQKEKSLLQKLYRESLQTATPQKIPKIKQDSMGSPQNFIGHKMNITDGSLKIIGGLPVDPSSSPNGTGQQTIHLHQTFGQQIILPPASASQTRFLHKQHHHYRLDGRTIKTIGNSSLKAALVKIPTIESVRSNATHSSLNSQLRREYLF